MKLSTKTRYGARILIELALKQDQGPVQVSQIAESQKIPVKYLEQILRILKQTGFVTSVRGPKGGHLLTKSPEKIFLGEIVRYLESQTDLVHCVTDPEGCEMSADCLVRDAWQNATSVLYDNLDKISIASLLKGERKQKGGSCL